MGKLDSKPRPITWDDFDRASHVSHNGAVSWRSLAIVVHRADPNMTIEAQNSEFAETVKAAKQWMKAHENDLVLVKKAHFVPGVGTEPATYRRQ